MAFRYSGSIAVLVEQDPRQAHSRLLELFQTHKTRTRVAEHLGVAQSTIYRWVCKLESCGLKDPCEAAKKIAHTKALKDYKVARLAKKKAAAKNRN